MNFVPKYYKTHPLSCILSLESVQDNRGDLYYCVTIAVKGEKKSHFMFKQLNSAIDFISTNYNH